MRGWIEAIRSFGYAVFAKPKLHPDDDVDLDMLAHIADRAAQRRLVRLIVASGDGRNFLEPLEDLARAGVQVVVLSFSEVAGYAMESDLLTFLDLEDVPGAFVTPLERVRLDALPAEGAWLRPSRSMREVAARVSRTGGARARLSGRRAQRWPTLVRSRAAARPKGSAHHRDDSSRRSTSGAGPAVPAVPSTPGAVGACAPPAHACWSRCCSPRRGWG